MFGTYRFALALLVAAGHMRLFKHYHVGASAVIGFYLLSGFVMNHSFRHNFKLEIKNLLKFYLDRALRIYPVYIFSVFVIMLYFIAVPTYSIIVKPVNILANLTIVPLNYFMYLGKENYILLSWGKMAVPVAPSLALEIQFYLLVPFLLFYKRLMYIVFPLSLLIFLLAAFNYIHTYYFGYILLPGMLSIFLMGTMLYNYIHGIDARLNKAYLLSTLAILFIAFIVISFTGEIDLDHNLEVFTGIFSGIAAIYVLSRVNLKSKLDDLLGNLSYPIFLLHWLSIWVFNTPYVYNALDVTAKGLIVLQIVFTVVISAIAYYLVDRSVQKWRKRIQVRGVGGIKDS